MFETDAIFNDIKSLITTEVSVEDNERGNMDYLFWIICDDNSIPKLKRFLSVYPSCIFSEPFESEELLKEIRESEREQWMKFIGVDFKYMSLRRLLHFRENVLNIIGHGKSNFIIKYSDYSDKYKMRAGGNKKEFFCYVLKMTKTQAERQSADIRFEIVSILSDRMYDDIMMLYLEDDFVDISKFTEDLQICLNKDVGCWFNVYKDNINSLIESDNLTGSFMIYRCGYKKLSDGSFDFIMILRNDHHGPSRIVFRKTFNTIHSFFDMTTFELNNTIKMNLIKDEDFERLFSFIPNVIRK